MKGVSATKVKARFSNYLEQCTEGPVIVTKNGRPTAVLLAVSDEEELERLVLAHTPRFMGLLDNAEKRIGRSGGIEHKEFWRAVKKGRR
ncbi:type II toxin-antitoxin system Phd/YefM family antitoxin [bacterium]|nr:MAG: type II toxin-antitoxin system Phd/YefM family antitoxin [bacterium]